MQSSQRRRGSWSDLPVEVVRSIAAFLDASDDDLHHFRAVCKKWRASIAITSLLPHQINSLPPQQLLSTSVYLLRPRAAVTTTTTTTTSDSTLPCWIVTAIDNGGGQLQLHHPFTKTPLQIPPENHPDHLTRHCHASRLAVGYHLTGDAYDKVLLTSSSKSLPLVISDCSLLGLYGKGKLGGYHLNQNNEDEICSQWIEVSHGSKFDDVIKFRGMVCALECQGKLYSINTNTFVVENVLIDHPICNEAVSWKKGNRGRRKRLVASDKLLYMIVMQEEEEVKDWFKVYKWSKDQGKSRMWVEVKDFEDRVMFVTRDCGFFVAVEELTMLRNCIVFSELAFPPYSSCGSKKKKLRTQVEIHEEDIRVFELEGKHGDHRGLQSISSYPGLAMVLSSSFPPNWVFHPPASHSQPHGESDKDENVQSDSNSQDSPFQEEDQEAQSFEPELQEPTADIPSTSTAQGITMGADLIMNDVGHVAEQGCDPRTSREEIHSTQRAAVDVDESDLGKMLGLLVPANRREEIEKDPRKQIVAQSCLAFMVAMKARLEAAHQEVIQEYFHQKEKWAVQMGGLETKLKHAREKITKLEDEKVTSAKTLAKAITERDSLRSEVVKLRQKLADAEAAAADVEERVRKDEKERVKKLAERTAAYVARSASVGARFKLDIELQELKESRAPNYESRKREVNKNYSSFLSLFMKEHGLLPREKIPTAAELAGEGGNPRSVLHTTESSNEDTSTIMFEGLAINASLVPTLQNIWSKHGNVIENTNMRDNDMLAKALELLAKAVLTLKWNSARSLDDKQVNNLTSTLSVLQCMCFRVDWLAPFVEKAVNLHKSKEMRTELEALHQDKAKTVEMMSTLVDQLVDIETIAKELELCIDAKSKMISFLEVDMDESLGAELP